MKKVKLYAFLLTRPLRDVTLGLQVVFHVHDISTHTPLAGRDMLGLKTLSEMLISTHTPLAGRDALRSAEEFGAFWTFLLTRPLRDVTIA